MCPGPHTDTHAHTYAHTSALSDPHKDTHARVSTCPHGETDSQRTCKHVHAYSPVLRTSLHAHTLTVSRLWFSRWAICWRLRRRCWAGWGPPERSPPGDIRIPRNLIPAIHLSRQRKQRASLIGRGRQGKHLDRLLLLSLTVRVPWSQPDNKT